MRSVLIIEPILVPTGKEMGAGGGYWATWWVGGGREGLGGCNLMLEGVGKGPKRECCTPRVVGTWRGTTRVVVVVLPHVFFRNGDAS